INSTVHLRLGPIERLQLGSGHVVNFFNSTTAWDDRTVGVEFGGTTPLLSFRLFTDNVLLDGVTGGRIGLSPLYRAAGVRTRSLEVGLTYVTDLSTWQGERDPLIAYNVDLGFTAAHSGDVAFTPFASFAWYE